MAEGYERVNWEDLPSTNTPLNAENLNKMDKGIEDAHKAIVNSGFITKAVTDLINYYTKSETYTQEEINQLVSTIPKFSIKPVKTLPTEEISTTTVYLLTTGEESQNLYTEYIYVNGKWEKLGTQKLDLSSYALKTDIPTKLSELVNDSEFITAAVDNLVNYCTKKEVDEKLYLKANSFISTTSGTSIPITDAAKVKPKNIKLFGKTEQPSTEGNQLLPYPYHATTKTENGITFTDNGDGSITITGTCTGNAYFNFVMSGNPITLGAGTYKLSGAANDITIVVFDVNNNTYLHSPFEITEDAQLGIWIDISKVGTTFNTTIFPMLYQNGDGTWEPYTGGEASPNMNYPQPLNHHGDSGSIAGKVLNENVYNPAYRNSSNGIFTIYCEATEKNGVYTLTATDTDMMVWGVAESGQVYSPYVHGPLMEIPEGITKISVKMSNSKINKNPISYFDKNKISMGHKSGNSSEFTQEILDGAKYFNIRFGKGDAVVGETYETTVMVNYGEPMDYKPYTEQPFTALTPNGLPGIPLGQTIPDTIKNSPIHMAGVYWDNATSQYYIGDTVEFESGEYVQRIEDFGIENYSLVRVPNNSNWYDSEKSYSYECEGPSRIDGTFGSYCTHAIHYSFNDFYLKGIENGCYIGVGNFVLNISKSLGICTTIDEFKQYCKNNDVKISQILTNPIITDLTQEELSQYNALLMNYPNTTIVNDAGAYMEVEYVADTQEHIKQNYIPKSEHEALKARVSDIEQAIANL